MNNSEELWSDSWRMSLMDNLKDYLNKDAILLDNSSYAVLLSNLMELETGIRTVTALPVTVDYTDEIREMFLLTEECSKLKSMLSPFFRTMTSILGNYLSSQGISVHPTLSNSDKLQEYEVSRYESVLRSISKELKQQNINGLEEQLSKKQSLEEALEFTVDTLIESKKRRK